MIDDHLFFEFGTFIELLISFGGVFIVESKLSNCIVKFLTADSGLIIFDGVPSFLEDDWVLSEFEEVANGLTP